METCLRVTPCIPQIVKSKTQEREKQKAERAKLEMMEANEQQRVLKQHLLEQQRAAGGNHDDSSDAQPSLETVDPAGKANTG